MKKIRVMVNGAFGNMGKLTVTTVSNTQDMECVAQLGSKDNLMNAITQLKPDVVIDFTKADVAVANTKMIIDSGTRAVIGTTGFLPEHIAQFTTQCAKQQLGVIIAPNFSIQVILMMRMAALAATYLPHVEIIEGHRLEKADAPSGTAMKTAEMIASARGEFSLPPAKELLAGARGAKYHNIPIHSLRLPGILANQEVIFGSLGETLSITHHTLDRQAFMPGVLVAVRKVLTLDHLVHGLENII